jgi:tagatose-1,6-bisphosphate aldolase non-catalytic subunit AgaZ/GatZ
MDEDQESPIARRASTHTGTAFASLRMQRSQVRILSGAPLSKKRENFRHRIRYYWPNPEAQAVVNRLFAKLGDGPIPEPFISQYLGGLYPEVVDGSLSARPRDLVIGAALQVLRRYDHACSHL